MMPNSRDMEKIFSPLVAWGVLTKEQLVSSESAATARGIELDRILIREQGVPKHTLLKALSEYYHCPSVKYDERMPVPPEILTGLNAKKLSMSRWFPIIQDGDTVVIAAADPVDPAVLHEVETFFPGRTYKFWVALSEDIQWFIGNFLHAEPGSLIGTERTGLAFWRNTMAHWRTRLACYRNDLARSRTDLAIFRWGLGLIAISNALMRVPKAPLMSFHYLYWAVMALGFCFSALGLTAYIRISRFRIAPPPEQTLVEVTAATLQFLENYHFIEHGKPGLPMRRTMLARLGDFLLNHCTILYPPPASRERTHLARERNVLAAQRTVAACYRTIYARARTGLAFIRSGVSFASLGLGLIHYFVFSLLTVFDFLLVLAGVLLVADGLLWYMPVRKEQSETPRCLLYHP